MKVSKEAGSDELWLGDKFTKDLPVQLTDKELEARAKEMSGAQVELTGLEEEKKATMRSFSERMKPLQSLVKGLAPVVSTGVEQREVPVRWRQELGASSAVLVRLDTHEVLEETRRALNPAELDGLQTTLGFGRSGGPAPEETPSSLLNEVLSLGFTEDLEEKTRPANRATTDYRKAPANANRGVEMCATEEEHEYGPPDAEGWQPCRKCPADRRIVTTATLTDMGEEDLSASQAALDALDAGPKAPSLRWPLGDTAWMLSIEDDQLWFHSPELASSSSRRHGPAGWVPDAHGTDRIAFWNPMPGDAMAVVPLIVIAAAVSLLDSGAEGLVLPRPMSEVKAAIAAERAADMEKWDMKAEEFPIEERASEPHAAPGGDTPSLTDAGSAFLRALLDGPKTLEQVRAKTNNRRPLTTANSLVEKGLVEHADPSDGPTDSPYRLTPLGRQVAEQLQASKEAKGKKGAGG